jgi:hypothetical protein
LVNLHIFGDITENGWLNEEALITFTIATGFDLCAGLFASINVAA